MFMEPRVVELAGGNLLVKGMCIEGLVKEGLKQLEN